MLLSRECVSEGGAATRGGVTAGDPDDADAAPQLGLGVHVKQENRRKGPEPVISWHLSTVLV